MQDLKWWQRRVIYQIYPRSFQDSNGDGIGDLSGIIRRLDHVVTLGIDAIRIPPIILPPWRILDLTSQIIAMWRGSSGTSRIWTDWSRRPIGEGSDSFRISFPTTLPTSIPGLLKVEAYAPIRKETGTSGEMPVAEGALA